MVERRKPRKAGKAFADSQIVAQKLPKSRLVGKKPLKERTSADGTKYKYSLLTKQGYQYHVETDRTRAWLARFRLDRKRTATVMAFCRNYFIRYQELPSRRTLAKLFRLKS
jgi:hypothetical protein